MCARGDGLFFSPFFLFSDFLGLLVSSLSKKLCVKEEVGFPPPFLFCNSGLDNVLFLFLFFNKTLVGFSLLPYSLCCFLDGVFLLFLALNKKFEEEVGFVLCFFC